MQQEHTKQIQGKHPVTLQLLVTTQKELLSQTELFKTLHQVRSHVQLEHVKTKARKHPVRNADAYYVSWNHNCKRMVTNLASSQNACLAGSYQPNSGQSSCLDADAGYFVANAGSTSQSACPAGTYQA